MKGPKREIGDGVGVDLNLRAGKTCKRTISPPRDDAVDPEEYISTLVRSVHYMTLDAKDKIDRVRINDYVASKTNSTTAGSSSVGSGANAVPRRTIIRHGDRFRWETNRLMGGTEFYVGKDLPSFLRRFHGLIGNGSSAPQEVELAMGRTLRVQSTDGSAYVSFADLCDKHLGAADYCLLLQKFHTLAVGAIPLFGSGNIIPAYNFVDLVDAVYDAKARFLCLADGSPTELFKSIVTTSEATKMLPTTAGLYVDDDIGAAKIRTIQRLSEIGSSKYLAIHASLLAERMKEG